MVGHLALAFDLVRAVDVLLAEIEDDRCDTDDDEHPAEYDRRQAPTDGTE
jgi:hypothetical protein